MILITGANGHFGQATIDALLSAGFNAGNIAGLVRDTSKGSQLHEKGIHVKIGDYDNYDSLVQAFLGVEKLLFISGNDMAKRVSQHQNVVNAAKEAGVKHIFYTSIYRQSESEQSPLHFILSSHLATEAMIKASGLNYTILKNNLYTDVIPWFLGEKVLETGIFFPAGDGKISFALRTEMAEGAARLLLSDAPVESEYNISGPAVSFSEMASLLKDITGVPVHYHNISVEEYNATLNKMGVPADYTAAFTAFAATARIGELEAGDSQLEILLGRKPAGVEGYLRQVYARS